MGPTLHPSKTLVSQMVTAAHDTACGNSSTAMWHLCSMSSMPFLSSTPLQAASTPEFLHIAVQQCILLRCMDELELLSSLADAHATATNHGVL